MKKMLLFIVVFVSVFAAISYFKSPITPRGQDVQGPSCDMSLWAHVYHGRFASAEDRLQVVNPCVTVTGTVMNARQEEDGDWHIQLDLDSEYGSLLNQANLEKQQGYLVLEPMCSNHVSQADTIEEGVCNGFPTPQLAVAFHYESVAAGDAQSSNSTRWRTHSVSSNPCFREEPWCYDA